MPRRPREDTYLAFPRPILRKLKLVIGFLSGELGRGVANCG